MLALCMVVAMSDTAVCSSARDGLPCPGETEDQMMLQIAANRLQKDKLTRWPGWLPHIPNPFGGEKSDDGSGDGSGSGDGEGSGSSSGSPWWNPFGGKKSDDGSGDGSGEGSGGSSISGDGSGEGSGGSSISG